MIFYRNLRRFFYKTLKQPGYALKVLARRLEACLYYLYSNGRSGYPEAMTLFLTHKCNLHCKMCGQWGEGGVTKKQSMQYIKEELSLNVLKALIDDVSAFRPNITLFGGEPLLYSGCVELIRYIKEKRMHCLVITNGFLLKAMAEDVVDSGLDELNVSLDGGRDLHDEIRGMPGLFDKIMSGLKEVNRFKGLRNKKKPLINLQCTITKYNYRYLEQMIGVASEARANSLTFHNLIFTDKDVMERQRKYDERLDCSSMDWKGFIFDPGIDTGVLYGKMKEVLSGKYPFSVDFYPNLGERALAGYYQDPSFVPPDYPARCLSPWIVAYIFPDGEVRPCLNCTYSYGNVRHERFSSLWNNERAVKYRSALKENKMFPVCARCTELYRY